MIALTDILMAALGRRAQPAPHPGGCAAIIRDLALNDGWRHENDTVLVGRESELSEACKRGFIRPDGGWGHGYELTPTGRRVAAR